MLALSVCYWCIALQLVNQFADSVNQLKIYVVIGFIAIVEEHRISKFEIQN